MSPIAVADEVSIAGGMPSSTLDRPSTIRTGDLVVDLDSHLVSVHDNPVRLTAKEYSILYGSPEISGHECAIDRRR